MKGLRIEWSDGDGWIGAGCGYPDMMVGLRPIEIKEGRRAYFTKSGWEKFGKPTLKLMVSQGVKVRVLKTSMSRPLYKDKFQFVQ